MRASREPMTIAELKRYMDRRFMTREEFRRDLRRFATKRDLRRFATKQELRRFTVDIKRHFRVLIESLEQKLDLLAERTAEIGHVNERLQHHDLVLDNHEVRISGLEHRA